MPIHGGRAEWRPCRIVVGALVSGSVDAKIDFGPIQILEIVILYSHYNNYGVKGMQLLVQYYSTRVLEYPYYLYLSDVDKNLNI
jgi:hypothetical protein